MSTALTSAQSGVLAFVRQYRRENQMPPTRAEIAQYFGWVSANSAEQHLQALASKGVIRLQPGRPRGIFDLQEVS